MRRKRNLNVLRECVCGSECAGRRRSPPNRGGLGRGPRGLTRGRKQPPASTSCLNWICNE
ncbi:hypothetical protein E2C01_010226 [Portunus trituberculatus]|uniref:Uncharacterized protein n=1 Tax=Portunus trituberculatus TaxID=210409 RepID=A0A5B7D844_PORTR|nr:hypothetical protein [Portunus trituberculatus]